MWPTQLPAFAITLKNVLSGEFQVFSFVYVELCYVSYINLLTGAEFLHPGMRKTK